MGHKAMTIFRLILIFSVLAGGASFDIAWSAEISLPESGRHLSPLKGVLIEGQIVKGDYKRFQYLALTVPPEGNVVWLASPGGDLAEAVKIGLLVRRLKLDVQVPVSNKNIWSIMLSVSDPRNNVCASACFFIYAAGVHRSGDILGVHRPRITEEDLKNLTMNEAALGQTSANDLASTYLRKMGVPASIIEKMQTTKPNDIQWLNEDELKSLSGYIPQYEDWLDARCPYGTEVPEDRNPCKDCSANELLKRWQFRAKSQQFECKSKLIDEERQKAHSEMIEEYVKNGRIKELVDEQKQACVIQTVKNKRECPKPLD